MIKLRTPTHPKDPRHNASLRGSPGTDAPENVPRPFSRRGEPPRSTGVILLMVGLRDGVPRHWQASRSL